MSKQHPTPNNKEREAELKKAIIAELKDADLKGTGFVSNRIMQLIQSDRRQFAERVLAAKCVYDCETCRRLSDG